MTAVVGQALATAFVLGVLHLIGKACRKGK